MGTLVPPWYERQPTSETGLLVAAFSSGSAMAVAAFNFGKATRQTRRSWKRSHRVNAYIVMIWIELSTCIVTLINSWLFLRGTIPPSVWYFAGMLVLWALQIQCLMQILANRLSLILYNPVKARWLKLGLLIAIGIINVSVFCIWVPARLQISETWIRINNIWDRIEKAIFAAIDMALNVYFMWLVKSKLVASGLTQYNLVYRVNVIMVCLSISLDILVIGLMSLKDDAVYVQAHPLTFLAKLHIEMMMAELLGKVLKKSQQKSATRTADVYQGPQAPQCPHLGHDMFDWLGSAKDMMVPAGGQMHELNTGILNEPTRRDAEDPQRRSGQVDTEGRTSTVHEVHAKDSSASLTRTTG